jgi:Fe-S-cluster containining protein
MIGGSPMLNVLADVPACAGCGICCHLVVELRPGVDDVPEELVVEHEGVRCMDQRGDGACVALDFATRLCTIYERRPQTCRDFKRGGPLCRQVVAKAGEASAREGGSPS